MSARSCAKSCGTWRIEARRHPAPLVFLIAAIARSELKAACGLRKALVPVWLQAGHADQSEEFGRAAPAPLAQPRLEPPHRLHNIPLGPGEREPHRKITAAAVEINARRRPNARLVQ